jgi:hypothetical protein
MGLMKLLPTSRAFGKIVDQPSRYKLSQQTLPKFGPARPVAPKAEAEEIAVSPSPEDGREAPRGTLAARPTKAGLMNRFQKIFNRRANKTMKTTDGAGPSASEPARSAHAAASRRRWSLFKNPFKRPVKSEAQDRPVQAELLLAIVRPMRNDLSDSDIEIVPVSTEPCGRPPGDTVLESAKPKAVEAGLNQVPTEIFQTSRF